MDIPHKRPFVLDGAIATNLMMQGMPAGKGSPDWMLKNSAKVADLIKSFIEAGSMAVLAPTFGMSESVLSEHGDNRSAAELNRKLVDITLSAAAGKVPVGGSVSPSGIEIQPFGEGTFSRLIADYKEQMAALQSSGVSFVMLEAFTNVVDIRAAIIAARPYHLPVFACVTVNDECRTPWNTDVLAALIVAQNMGAAAFGISCSAEPEFVLSAIKRIYPYAKIPIIAKPNAGKPSPIMPNVYDYSPEYMAKKIVGMLKAGAQIIGGCCGTTPEHIKAIAAAASGFDPSIVPEKAEDETIAANHNEAFFITDSFSPSNAIGCTLDMSEPLLSAEDAGYDAITVYIKAADDANLLAMNAHMATLPVIIKADDEALLEAALMQYQGRALVDSRSFITEDRLRQIAAQYGAVVY